MFLIRIFPWLAALVLCEQALAEANPIDDLAFEKSVLRAKAKGTSAPPIRTWATISSEVDESASSGGVVWRRVSEPGETHTTLHT